MRDPLHKLCPESRRLFLERCARAAFGVSMLPLLDGSTARGAAAALENSSTPARAGAASPQTSVSAASNAGPGFGSAKRIIVLRLDGGMSHIDTFDPKQGPSKGPKGAISTKAGFQISEFLPHTALVAEQLCVIRSMSAKVGVHQSARYLMRTGFDPRGTIKHPVIGAWAQHYLGASHNTLPSSVCINHNSDHGNGFFPATYTPLPIIDPDAGLQHSVPYSGIKSIEDRLKLVHQVDSTFQSRFPDETVGAYNDFYDTTVRLMKSTELRAFDLKLESQATRSTYGESKFGRGCLLARRLVENGVRFVEVSSNGWDMHNNLEDAMEGTGAEFDQGFAALVSDLHARGMLQDTLVAVTTEFGRKPDFSGSGRGHYPTVFSTVLAGAGVKRGFVYGKSDASGGTITENPVNVGELHASLGWAAGLPMDKVITSPSGRPFTVGNQSRPVHALFA